MNIAYFSYPSSIHDCKWINHFVKKNHVIIITNKGEEANDILSKEVQVYSILPNQFPFKNLMKRFKTIRKIRSILKKEKIDLVHSLYAVPNAFWGELSCWTPHIITTRGSDLLIEYKSFCVNESSSIKQKAINLYLKNLFERSIQNAVAVTGNSKKLCKELSKITVVEKVHLIQTGIDLSLFKNPNLKKQQINNKITLFHPRGTKKIYNIHIIIKSYYTLLKKIPEAKLKMTSYPGSEKDIKHIESLLKKLGLQEKVTILPKLTQEEMLSEYLSSTVVLMMPKSDGIALAGMEAMLVRKPLIVGPLPYDEDIYNNNTVWQSKTFDYNEIADLLYLAINDPNKQKKVDLAYKRAKEKASLSNSLKQVEKLYKKVLQKHG